MRILRVPRWAVGRAAEPEGLARGCIRGRRRTDHTTITDGQLDVLLEEFTVPQVVELLTWIVFEHAGEMFGAFTAAVAGQPRAASCEPETPPSGAVDEDRSPP